MNTADELESRIKRLRWATTDVLDQRILADASAVLADADPQPLLAPPPVLWRVIMSSKWTKLAAAVLFVITLSGVTLHYQWTTEAYALEQTLQANLSLRSIHVRVESNGESREMWAEFADNGQLSRLRINSPNSDDGDKQVVFQNGKTEVWFKTKGNVLVLRDKEALEKISKELAKYDPRVMTQELYDAQSKGKAKIETEKSAIDAAPIKLVVTSTDAPNEQQIYWINPKTKLLQQFKKYHVVGGKMQLIDTIDFLSYNEPIPADTFVLDVPEGVTRLDWTTEEIGLAKGELSETEIAKKVAREFFEALIAKDYAKAGSIYSGLPEAKVKDSFGKFEFNRIVSIGEPKPFGDIRLHVYEVPCEVEWGANGITQIRKFVPYIRPVEGQPDHWLISGGI